MRNKKICSKTAYRVGQWTWGFPQTFIGALLHLRHRDKRSFDYNGAKVTVWDKDEGVSLGRYLFVPDDGQFLLEHEYGHSIQSLILGPLYLILIGAPSLLWNRLPYFKRLRKDKNKSYYSVVFERTASQLGSKHKR